MTGTPEEILLLRESLRLCEERFLLVSRATNDAVWDWDLKRDVLWWGENFYSTYHYSRGELEPGIASWEKCIHPEDVQRVSESIHGCIAAGGQSWESEYRFRGKDGMYRDILDRGSVQRDATGKALRMVGAMVDVTLLKRSEVELHRIHEELEARVVERTQAVASANEALEAFTYSVSHDLRAPLRHIKGFVQLLARNNMQRLDDEGRRYLSVIMGAADKMSELIEALLSFSRIGKGELQDVPVDLTSVVAEAIQNLEAEARGREVRWNVHPLCVVRGDPVLLRLVATNLLDNALKYTRTKPVAEIEIGCRNEAGGTVFFVKDNGVGFDMKYAQKLFCVFQRLHTEREFEGHGVGLANVKRIIQRHGGRVWAEAQEGVGATFYFSLPRTEGGQGGNLEHI